MIISCASLCAHDIIPPVSFGQMRAFDASPVCPSAPQLPGIAQDFLFFRRIFHHADGARLFIALPGLPLQRYHPFPAVVIVKQGSVKACGVKIHRLAPGSLDVFGSDEVIIHIKVSGIHGIHHAVHHIKQVLLLTIGQTGRPDSFRGGKPSQIRRVLSLQYMGQKLPIFQIPGMVHRNSRKPFKGGYRNIIIFSLSADAGVRVKSRQYGVLNHVSLPPLISSHPSQTGKSCCLFHKPCRPADP